MLLYKGLLARKLEFMYVVNKGADQPEHQRSLISTFDIHILDVHIMTPFATYKIFNVLASLCS